MKFFITLATAICALLMLTGCITCAVLIEAALKAGEHKKDISNDPRCKDLIGKKFVLTDDAYLYRYYDSNDLHLDRTVLGMVYGVKTATRAMDNKALVPFCELVRKGTVIQVTRILIATSFGEELFSQYILAQFLHNSATLVTADCSDMFKDIPSLEKETGNFEPNPDMLAEIYN